MRALIQIRTLFLFFFLGFFTPDQVTGTSLPANPQDAFTTLLTNGFTSLYEYNFSAAEASFKNLEKQYPAEPMTYILGLNIVWWQIVSGNEIAKNKDKFQQYLRQANARNEQRSKSSKKLSHPDIYARILTSFFGGRIHLHERNLVQAASAMQDCLKYLKISAGQELAYEPYFLSSGLYSYFLAYAKEKPAYFPFTFYLSGGDKAKGISFLKTGQKSQNIMVSTESSYFLMMISGEMEENWLKAEQEAAALTRQFPGNLWYLYYYFKCALQQNKPAETQQRFKQLVAQSKINPSLSPVQQNYFIRIAQKDMQKAGLKLSTIE